VFLLSSYFALQLPLWDIESQPVDVKMPSGSGQEQSK